MKCKDDCIHENNCILPWVNDGTCDEFEPIDATELPGSEPTNFNKGTWYQNSESGLWYTESGATGDVAQIRLNGVYYIPFKSLKDKGL